MRFLFPLVLILFAEVYTVVALRLALRPLPKGWRVALMTLYVIVTLIAWAGFLSFRRINWSSWPHGLRNAYVAGTLGLMVGKVLILAVMLLDEIRRLIAWIIGMIYSGGNTEGAEVAAKPGITRSQFFVKTALALGGASVIGFFYGITNRYDYRIRRITLRSPKVPPGFDGARIAQLSDIHSGSFDNPAAVARGVQMVLDEKPDVIFFTGDLVNNKADELGEYAQIFAKLKAPLGVYSTLGNHDYGDYVTWPSAAAKTANLQTLAGLHKAMGWRLMMNEHILLERGGDNIGLIGIENWSAKANFPRYGRMAEAVAGMPEVPFKILLSHDPSHWEAQVVKQHRDVDLTLSGHTHGMQFGIELPFLKWSPVKLVYKQWAGLYEKAGQWLYVNRGFGFLGYPGRLGILPEITVITLERSEA